MEKSFSFSYSKASVKIGLISCMYLSRGKLGICRVHNRPVSRDRRILINSWKWKWVSQLCISHVAY